VISTAKKPFREAAAVVIVRDRGGALEVFWVKRSDRVSFMPEFHAFVGGTVDASDLELEMEGATADELRLLQACAIRETFEETGILVGLTSPARDGDAGQGWSESRRRLLQGETTFSALAREHGWKFRADDLTFAGRWKTPPFSAARFDTIYFLARLPEGQEPAVRMGELEMGEWIAPERALAKWKRGEATFAAPILHTLLELERGEPGLADRLATAPERAGQPVGRVELKWGVVLHAMKTNPLPPATLTNAYLVGEREVALIDPGSGDPDELERLFALIETLAGEGRKLALILLTHHHPDHVGGVEAVRKRYQVPVAAHAETAKHLAVERTLADGDRISLASDAPDWTLRVLHTPGHTRGSLCFLNERRRSLFTGDHVTGGTGTVIIDPPDGNMDDYIASLNRLLREPVATLFPGHGTPQGAAIRRIKGLIAHRLERETKVAAALEREPRSLEELVERAYEDTPRELWGYAQRSLLAHLLRLERQERAVRDGERWRRRNG
jgi:glyoxylase-like metal-dependent hydrolase (beta-lactamase superfamily II)/8-oxo-dGTP pyrophosphatase MutT (NUDIX family)